MKNRTSVTFMYMHDSTTFLASRDQALEHPLVTSFFPPHYRSQLEYSCYRKGEALCLQDDQLQSLFVILSGKVKIVRTLFNGKEHILGIESKPTIIGEVELLTDRLAVSSVIPLEDTWVVQLPLRGRRQEILSDASMLASIGRSLATSLYEQNIQASTNVAYSVKERLATHILEVEENGDFQLELSTLADRFGTSYRHLLRTLKRLTQEGILTKDGRHYRIQNRPLLEDLEIHE